MAEQLDLIKVVGFKAILEYVEKMDGFEINTTKNTNTLIEVIWYNANGLGSSNVPFGVLFYYMAGRNRISRRYGYDS
jgi:hypothetical protein